MNRLDRTGFAFRAARSDGQLLGDAAVSALDLDPTFDAGQALAALLSEGLVTAAEIDNPGGTA